MNSLKRLCFCALVVLVMGFPATIWAIPGVNYSYIEINLGSGQWRYDYTLFNISDPIADAGFDIYDIALYFNSSATLNVLSMPAGWDWISGSDFIETFSLNPGAPPIGTDIAGGSYLIGFSFQYDYQAGMLPFDATLVDPNDFSNPLIVSGTTTPISNSVPEPATMLLLGLGLVGLAGVRRNFKK